MNTVHVLFADPSYNYVTSVAATATEQSCREYFVGKRLNMGGIRSDDEGNDIEVDDVQVCTGIVFHSPAA